MFIKTANTGLGKTPSVPPPPPPPHTHTPPSTFNNISTAKCQYQQSNYSARKP